MSEAQTIETDSLSHRRNAARVAKEEAELNELLKQAGVIQDDDDSVQQEATEDVAEEEPVSEPETQEEPSEDVEHEAKALAQEDDSELSAEEKSFKKRYSDIRKYMQEKDAEYKAKLEKLE